LRYLLDTNVCVDYLTGRHPNVAARLKAAHPEDLCVSAVVAAELRYGADRSRRPRANHSVLDVLLAELQCVPFDEQAGRAFGRVRAELEAKGRPIGAYDMQIAAHALSLSLALVTDNVAEFSRVRGLRVVNWRS
jgi:tRNA(fMet)-specific endonuclease VapC